MRVVSFLLAAAVTAVAAVAAGAVSIAAAGCDAFSGPRVTLSEASGIARDGEWIIVVGDEAHGGYFRHAIAEGPLIPLLSRDLTWVRFGKPLEAQDLESIDVLADGRVVALSEELAVLVGGKGIVARYEKELRPVDRRGLEGLAVRPLRGGASRVAVLWEGGYPPSTVPQVASRLRPLILVHDLARDEEEVEVVMDMGVRWDPGSDPDPNLGDVDGGARGGRRPGRAIDVASPPVPGGEDRCFRAPDLVWHHDPREGWGFILLLSSEGPRKGDRYAVQWLLRVRTDGTSYGAPLDLHAVAPKELRGDHNWEGLGWFEPGRRVVLVHDTPPYGTPTAWVVELPEDW